MKKMGILLVLSLAGAIALSGCGSNNGANTQQPAAQQPAAQQPAQTTAPATDMKTGVANMLTVTSDLNKAIEAGDEAKVKELGPKLEDAWRPFEDGVKDKFPQDYETIEKALDPTIAGSQVSPLDKETLKKLNDQLTAALNDLAKKAE